MESWSYASEEKGYLLSDEMDFSLEAFVRGRKALVDWDNKASCNFEKDDFSSDGEVVKSMEVLDLGFSDLFRTGNQPSKTSNFELDRNSSKRVNSPTHVIALDSSLVEEESELKHSGSLVESKSHDSSLIDLKLGRLVDCKEASSDKIAKRVRTSSSPTQTPVCQVYGCNMDLSSSKEYHKRHKVCDVHSKTAKVIVNGIEQRFCQQCSRFHLLVEFDEGKRSCRRRLAGHNERRRKPQFDYMSCKPHKMLQSYQGTKYMGPSFQKRPQLAFEDIFRSGIFNPGKYEQTRQSGHIKFEDESVYCPQLAPIIHGQELSRASNTSCALSLLSVQSQNLSCLSAENPVSSSLIFPSIHTHSSDDRVSEIPLGVNFLDKYAQNESSSHGMNSMEDVKNGSIILPDDGHAAHLQVHNICQPSDLSGEHGATLDLFQLSSHLRRVEHQRNSFFQ